MHQNYNSLWHCHCRSRDKQKSSRRRKQFDLMTVIRYVNCHSNEWLTPTQRNFSWLLIVVFASIWLYQPCWPVWNWNFRWSGEIEGRNLFIPKHYAQVRCENEIYTSDICLDLTYRSHYPIFLLSVSYFYVVVFMDPNLELL